MRKLLLVCLVSMMASIAPVEMVDSKEKTIGSSTNRSNSRTNLPAVNVATQQSGQRLLPSSSSNLTTSTPNSVTGRKLSRQSTARKKLASAPAGAGSGASSSLFKPGSAFTKRGKKVWGAGSGKTASIQALAARSKDSSNFSVLFDGESLRVLRGKFSTGQAGVVKGQARSFSERAKSFIGENSSLFGLVQSRYDLIEKRSWAEESGKSHVVYQKALDGIPIISEEISVHGRSDHVYYVNARYKNLGIDPASSVAISTEQAFAVIEQALVHPISSFSKSGKPALSLKAHEGLYRYVYELEVLTVDMVNWYYLVDASSGEIMEVRDNRKSEIVSASGRDGNGVSRQFSAWREGQTYYLLDPSIPTPDPFYDPTNGINSQGDQLTVDAAGQDVIQNLSSTFYSESSAQNSGWDPVGVSAHANTRTVFDYYLSEHGRNGIDDAGMNMISVIHYGQQLNNAYWNGSFMMYGDGDGSVFSPFADCLDVAAHELTHGVIQYSANLIYQNQSGALNESFADIMGAMVDDDDWLMGEDCTIASPGFLRSLSSPNSGFGSQPKNMSEYRNLPNTEAGDWGGVHANSGIPNRAAYLVADGLSTENLGTSIGRDKTAKIFYRALTFYLNPGSEFVDARYATEQAAEDLYGASSAELEAVSAAWNVVGVGFSAPPAEDAPLETVEGEDMVAYLYPIDGVYDNSDPELLDLYTQVVPDPFTGYDENLDIGPLNIGYYAWPTRPAPFTLEDEYYVLYVGLDFNVYIINPDGTEALWLEGENTNSIAFSPDLRYLATTPLDVYDNTINVYDFLSESWSSFPLQSPSYSDGAEVLSTALYADSIAFDYTGRKVIYDYFSCVPLPGELCDPVDSFGIWAIGELHVEENRFRFPFPAQPSSIDVGFPKFANNTDRYFVFDINDWSEYETTGEVLTGVLIFDTNSLDFELVGTPGIEGAGVESWGTPSFTGGDEHVVFQADDGAFGGKVTMRSPISDYSWTGGGVEQLNPFNATYPTAHRNVTRDISASLETTKSSIAFGEVSTNENSVNEFSISNTGNRIIEVTSVAITGEYFSHDLTNTTLSPGETIDVEVTLSTGRIGGNVAEVLSIDHNGDNSEIIVNLRATIVGSDIFVDPVDTNQNGAIDWDEGIRIGELTISGSDMQLLRLYSGALGRIPDLGGFDYWRDRIATGTRFPRMGDEFYWSEEMQIQMDADGSGEVTKQELVNHLYINVLQRAPDEEGFNYWLGRLDLGDSTGFVIASFLNGQEYIDSTTGLFADFALDNSTIWD